MTRLEHRASGRRRTPADLRTWRWPGEDHPSPRRLSHRPPTWDQVFGLLLGPLGFLVLLASLGTMTSAELAGLAYLGAGLAGLAVSAVDDRRSDWRARMAWSVGALTLGGGQLLGRPDSESVIILETIALAVQAGAALSVLANLRLSRLLMRTVTAVSAAAPTALILLPILMHPPYRPVWLAGVLHALSMIAFGLSRVARRPRGLRFLTR